ncbi:MAG TPA: MCP four helix bundle domain-containing protein, partial [Acidobacteriota bacterium]|nr:MCP four helix bundle domain-containing protein [Acidobacteriota bacterium]
MLNEMKIAKKLPAAFVAVAMAAVVVGVVGIAGMTSLSSGEERLLSSVTAPLLQLSDVEAEFNRLRALYLRVPMAAAEGHLADEWRQTEDQQRTLEAALAAYEKSLDSDRTRRALGEVQGAVRDYEAMGRQLRDAAGGGQRAEAERLLLGPLFNTAKVVNAGLKELGQAEVADGRDLAAASAANAARLRWLMIVVGLAAVGGAVYAGLRIARGVTGPLDKCSEVLRELAKGHLGARVDSTRADELGDMGRTMDEFAAGLQLLVAQMGKLADGNLDARVAAHDDRDQVAPAL